MLCEENLNWNYAHKELSSLGYEDVPEFAYDMCAQGMNIYKDLMLT